MLKMFLTLQNTLKKSNYYKRSLIVVLVIFLKTACLHL